MFKNYFLLNLFIVLAVALAGGFFISTKVYNDQWGDIMSRTEELLESKRFNLVDELKDTKPLSDSMVYNLNNQIFLLAQKNSIQSGDILNQAYFKDNFLGQAMVITNDGWLITDSSIEDQKLSELVVIDNDNNIIPVQESIEDIVLGITYLKIDKNGLNPTAIIDSDSLRVGEIVYGVKPNFYNYQHEVISTSIRNLHDHFIEKKTDLVYTPEDFAYGLLNNYMESDGLPLFNNQSQFIGFSVNLDNKTYLLPSKYIIYSFTSLFDNNQEIIYPSLGINYIDLSEVILENNLPNKGAYVYTILGKNNPLKVGDVITYIENDEINEVRSLGEILLDYQIDDEVNLTVIRDEQEIEVKTVIQSLLIK